MKQEGFIPIHIIAAIFVLLLGGGLYINSRINKQETPTNTPSPTTTSTSSAEKSSTSRSMTPSSTVKNSANTTPKITSTPTTTSRKTITVSGYIYEDRNNNGIFDADDQKIQFADLRWFDTSNPSVKFGLPADSSGSFSTTQSVLGNLGIQGFTQNNFSPKTGAQTFSSSTSGISVAFRATNAADQVGSGVIEGDIFQDSNRNGVKDSGENGIRFYKLYLVDSNDGYYYTTSSGYGTDDGGHYKYINLPFGTYTLKLSNPTGDFIMDRLETSVTLSYSNPSVTNIQIPVFKR